MVSCLLIRSDGTEESCGGGDGDGDGDGGVCVVDVVATAFIKLVSAIVASLNGYAVTILVSDAFVTMPCSTNKQMLPQTSPKAAKKVR